ncbi:MAG: hypothetical protein KF699_16000 [Phycisphaeraceae bacterium]|nr:hypothetical protein [Phycisphaeraceae bacterium]
MPDAPAQPVSPRRGKRRWILRIALASVVLIIVLVAIAPWIASRFAPGMVESAAGSSIQGSVRVSELSIGWFSPLRAGPIELRDPGAKVVARVEADSPITLWQVVRGGWWSAPSIDLGAITLRGEATIVRRPDGSTNLDEAIAPRRPATPAGKGGPAGGGGTTPDLKARLEIASISATVRDAAADGTLGPELGVKNLTGTIDAALQAAGATVRADLKARSVVGDTAEETTITFAVRARERAARGAAGLTADNLEHVDIEIEASRVPSALIDALAGFAGALQSGLAGSADVALRVQGDARNATINLLLDSPGVQAHAAMKLVDGVLLPEKADAPAFTLALTSTTFLANLPQAADLVAQAGDRFALDEGPSVQVVVGGLRVPLPLALLEGQPYPPAEIDLRGAGASIAVIIGAASGRAAIPEPGGTAGLKPFRTEPLAVSIDAADLAAPVRIRGGTSATIEGRSAGELTINLAAADLLDSNGRLRALRRSAAPSALPASIAGDIALDGVSTALLQPFTGATGLPLDLAADVGPSISLSLEAQTDAPTASTEVGAIPPTRVTVALRSQNIAADAALRLEGSSVRTTGEGVRVVVNSAAPLAARLLATGDGAEAPLSVAGRSGVELMVTDLDADLDAMRDGPPLAAVEARIGAVLADARATVALDGAEPGEVELPRAAVDVWLSRAAAPRITLDARAAHRGTPMMIAADIAAEGLKGGRIPEGAPFDRALALRLSGKIEARDVPPSLLALVPGAAKYAPGLPDSGRDELDAAIARIVSGATGAGVDATVTFTPPAGEAPGVVARVQMVTRSQGANADLSLRVRANEAALTAANFSIVAEPEGVNRALRAIAPRADGGRGIELGAASRVWVQVPEPVVVPLTRDADGTPRPDLARAGTLALRIASAGEVIVANIPVGSEAGPGPDDPPTPRLVSARLHKPTADLRAPLAALLDESLRASARASVKATTEVRGGGGSPIAGVSLDASAALDGAAPEALLTLENVHTANADALLGRPGLVSGALGQSASATVRIAPIAGAAGDLDLRAQVQSPAFSGADIALARRADRIALVAPAAITWTPAPEFLNSFLAGEDRSFIVTETAPVSLLLSRLVIAQGADGTGPLMPGVFDLDAQFSTARLGMSAAGRGEGASAHALSMQTIAGRVRWDASVPGTGGAGAGAIEAALSIGAVAANGGPAAQPSRVSAKVRSLIDRQGNLNTERALIDADADLNRFPTAVIDELASQGGLLTELLGPEVSMSATARSLTRVESGPRGMFEATLESPRASAQLVGDIRRGRFVQTGPSRIRVTQIRPQLVEQLAGGLPLVASMEKSASDDPAVVEMNDLIVPLDGDLSRLGGTISVDPGVARFTTRTFIGSLLKAVGGRAEGQLGRKIDPFVVKIDKGVATYERFRLPLGEFSIETKGQVDLVKRTMNLTTYVPFFALTDEAMGPIRLGLGGRLDLLDRNTLVPISIKGGMDRPSAMIDGELFLRETAGNIIQQPGRFLESIGDILGGRRNQEPERK